MSKNISIIIDDNKDHEGKYLVEVIKRLGNKKFIKNYKLNSQQLLILNETISKNHTLNVRYKSDNCHTLIPTSIENKYRHPEYRNQNLFSQNSFQETLNAKYGNYKPESQTSTGNKLEELEAYNSVGNFNSYISDTCREPKM